MRRCEDCRHSRCAVSMTPSLPDLWVCYVNDGFDFSTSSNSIMTYEHIERPIESAKFTAYEMFGEMRSSTQEEKNLYENMLARMSTPIDVDIFAL